MHKQGWRDYSVDLVGHHENDIDISVLAAKQKLPDMPPVRLTTTGMILGQACSLHLASLISSAVTLESSPFH